MRAVAVLGGAVSKFGVLEQELMDILSDASVKAFKDTNTENNSFDHVFVGNMSSGELNSKSGIANALVSELGLEPAFASKIENTSGSGGAALYAGWLAVASGQSNLTLVVGGEKMTNVSTTLATDIIATLTHDFEYKNGITLPSFAGLMARLYMEKYKCPYETLAKIAIKNHFNATLNPNAHFQKIITLEKVLNSPLIADPLRLYDFCPISDGAAALVLAPFDVAKQYVHNPIKLAGIGVATDTHLIHNRKNLLEMNSVKIAANQAYKMAKLEPKNINLIELHDMATILEIVQYEDLGFAKKGEGWKDVNSGITSRTGSIPINTSGGLKAKGHPIGATGVAQIVEITHQLQNKCGQRQVNCDIGLSCNVAGFANNAIVSILRR